MKVANRDAFLTEYSSDDAVRRYSKRTAGSGIGYLLEHEYGKLYRKALCEYATCPYPNGARVLEFGCGAGMNLIHLVDMLQRANIPLEMAYGTDFSERLVASANTEVTQFVAPENRSKIKFLTARNEELVSDLADGLHVPKAGIVGSFHLIFGVNTFRYCHRLGKAEKSASDIYDLLAPGGVCVMIDMNQKFPAFRSLLRDRLTKPVEERYLPSLEEYAKVFGARFELLEQRNFCWVPHSAGPVMLGVFRTLTPILDTVVPRFALRSLIVARKPATPAPPR